MNSADCNAEVFVGGRSTVPPKTTDFTDANRVQTTDCHGAHDVTVAVNANLLTMSSLVKLYRRPVARRNVETGSEQIVGQRGMDRRLDGSRDGIAADSRQDIDGRARHTRNWQHRFPPGRVEKRGDNMHNTGSSVNDEVPAVGPDRLDEIIHDVMTKTSDEDKPENRKYNTNDLLIVTTDRTAAILKREPTSGKNKNTNNINNNTNNEGRFKSQQTVRRVCFTDRHFAPNNLCVVRQMTLSANNRFVGMATD